MNDGFLNYAIALGLGLLVGLQRERTASSLAGFRTFALATLLGAVCSRLSADHGEWVVIAGLGSVAAMVAAANLIRLKGPAPDPGLTTEVALLVMFLVGVLAGAGERIPALVLGASTAVLLHLRPQLHSFARGLSEADMRAMMQFVVVALVVLPVLPDEAYGPFGVLNPQRMWWMVVLITGISLASYVAYKLLGNRGGLLAAGLLGGLISSTATTVTTARRSRGEAAGSPAALVVIALASTVVFGRVLLLVGSVAPADFRTIAPPLAIMLAAMVGLSLFAWLRADRTAAPPASAGNPTELKVALLFALLYGGVLLAAAAARQWFGTGGLFAVAVISGLTDMDAITLSTAQLAKAGDLAPELAGRVILTATLANIVFKAGVVWVLADRPLARQVTRLFAVALALGLWLVFRW